MAEHDHRVRVPSFPPYSTVQCLLPLLEGVPKTLVMSMMKSIYELTGTPRHPVDWSNPDIWIDERLSGEHASLATNLWEGSNGQLNPRHLKGPYYFIGQYGLIGTDAEGRYRVTDRGRAFVEGDSSVIRELDESEGLLHLLSILASRTRAKRSDLIPDWQEFLHEYSRFKSSSVVAMSLSRRLRNLEDRDLVSREGHAWLATRLGKEYVGTISRPKDPRRRLRQAIDAFNHSQRELLRKRLLEIDPYQFEHLICDLLTKMGYEDAEVTSQSGDRGVDVTATVQFGITTINEVVQVKRHRASIGRAVVDQLRGALPYHDALRGTLITIGKFSRGCTEAALFPGAAPITLIDGDRLLDLMLENGIGVSRRTETLYELDEEFFRLLNHNELEDD